MIQLFWVFLLSLAQASSSELVVYTYDSMIARGGLGEEIFPVFEKKENCKIRVLSAGDGGQLLTRLQLDAKRGKPTAQLVMGLDTATWIQAQPWLESWQNWLPQGYSELKNELRFNGFLSYDYSPLAFIVDRKNLKNQVFPRTIKDLLGSQLKRRILLEDPRTSMPGLSFLLYTKKILGASVWDFWKGLRTHWLTLTPGWEAAYSLFIREEAPLVWSYLTSQAYHSERDPNDRFQALIFDEGQPVEIEGASLVKGSFSSEQHRKLAQRFLEFLISPEVQTKIPKKNWMLPVRKDIDIPLSFKKLPVPKKLIFIDDPASQISQTLSDWNRVVE